MRLTVTLNIPPAGVKAWQSEYGVDRAEVREDIRSYVATTLQGVNGAEVAGWQVTVR